MHICDGQKLVDAQQPARFYQHKHREKQMLDLDLLKHVYSRSCSDVQPIHIHLWHGTRIIFASQTTAAQNSQAHLAGGV
jgi:hypothetical protein